MYAFTLSLLRILKGSIIIVPGQETGTETWRARGPSLCLTAEPTCLSLASQAAVRVVLQRVFFSSCIYYFTVIKVKLALSSVVTKWLLSTRT